MPVVGDVLADRYRIESVLGVGGMASVYRATDLRLDRQVAVKVLVANLAADAQFAERFNAEASAMAGFSHPNVAAVYDVEPGDPTTGREPFYVMEYCAGGSLADRLEDGGRMPPAELVPIVAAIADGLAELHQRGLIHRDIKPANILFANDRPKLADFGVARSEEPREGGPLTLPGSTLGTLPYLAPELAAGAPPSAASDVYALGVTIFQALTGRYPKPSMGTETIADADARAGTPLAVSTVAPDLGQGFDPALSRALGSDPLGRPSPTELAAELASGLEISGIARLNQDSVVEPTPMPGEGSGVDMAAATVVSAPPVQPAARPVQPVAPRPFEPQAAGPIPPSSTRSSRAGWVALAVIAVLLVIVAVSVLPRLLGGNAGPSSAPGQTSTPASAPSTATTAPSLSATILEALGRVDAAIAAARGGKDGLTGRDANELDQLAAAVRGAVEQSDANAATIAAATLSDRARALSSGLDKPRRGALLAALDGLSEALATP